ncbi:AzlD domain-containing protein [Ferrimonas kyonanensis]|uniref:AzlD domain-containing protein n=1 Tax=Ferrimonas kyonanensis TaxID=364763 RepID=UPI00040545E4|nr:AzlD domain-containing protein [Ferrimonas kyonanensis]
MITLTLLTMALLVFASRYLLLDPRLPLRLGTASQRWLGYSAPAVMTALAAPIVFVADSSLNLTVANPYLGCALLVVVTARLTANTLLSVVIGMGTFFSWTQWLS